MIYAILVLGLLLRLVLANQSFWLDEAASLTFATQTPAQLISYLAGDFHPPLYYFVLHFWLKLGQTSEWFLRLPSIVFGTLTILGIYLLLESLKIKTTTSIGKLKLKVSTLAALLLALNPLHIYYSQELRMYSLNAFLAVFSWYFLLKFINTPLKNKLRTSFIIHFILLTTLNIYTFYGAFFNLAAQLVFLLMYQRRQLKAVLLYLTIPLLAFLPWLPTLKQQLLGGEFVKSSLSGWSILSGTASLKALFLIPAKFTLGRINFSTHTLYLFAALIAVLYLFSLILLGLKHRQSRLFLIWFSIPILLAFLVSFKTPILGYWRYIYLIPAFTTLIVFGLIKLPAKLFTLNLFVVLTTFILANLLFWTTPAFQRENWRQALSFIDQNSNETSTSIFAFSDAFAPVFWYSPKLTYTAPLVNLSDSSQLDLKLSQGTLGKNKVFLFDYLSELTDPNDNIPTWLINAGFHPAQTHNFPGVGLVYEYQAE